MTTPTTTDAAPAHPARTERTERPERSAPARADRPRAPRLPSARAVEDRRHRAAQRQRGVEAGRQRPRVRERIENDLLEGRLRVDRPDRPARPLPRVGPLHAAQARHRRRQDRDPRAARARGRVLHAARAHRRRAAHDRAAARDRAASRPSSARDTADLTDRQNIQLHWIRGRGRARDLAPPRGASASARPRRAATCRASCSARPVAGIAADELIDPTPQIDEITRALHRRRVAREPAPQVQVRDHRPPQPGRRARDQRRRVRRGRAPRARHRLRPVGRRRPLDGAAARPSGSASSSRPSAWPRPGTASRRSSATTATGACATRRG